MEDEDLVRVVAELADRIRVAVAPLMGTFGARARVGTAVGGDATMEIDRVAEAVVGEFVAEKKIYSVYTEDAGLVEVEGARAILVVDPIDGTRPAAAGFESACISVAATEVSNSPTLDDVDAACVLEIKTGSKYVADSSGAVHIEVDGEKRFPTPTGQRDLESMFWAGGYRGRPYLPVSAAVARLADVCALGGSTFDLGSASYIMTRILTGQLDAYIDPALRVLARYPELEGEFLRAGGGSVVCNAPYDIAAAYLCLRNAGCIVTDAWGEPLGSKSLLGSDRRAQISVVAASNSELHRAILKELDASIEAMEGLIPCILAYNASLKNDSFHQE